MILLVLAHTRAFGTEVAEEFQGTTGQASRDICELGCGAPVTCEVTASCFPTTPKSPYLVAEGIYLDREDLSAGQPLVLDNVTLLSLLSTEDLDFDPEPGLHILCGMATSESAAQELSYFGLFEEEVHRVVSGDDDLRIPGDIALATLDFFDADTIQVDSTSELHNAELNFLSRDRDQVLPIQRLAGLRYLHLADVLNINATDLDTGTSDYNVRTSNDLFGAQLGCRLREVATAWAFSAEGKAGLYGNAANHRTSLRDFDNSFVFRDVNLSETRAAFICDLSLDLEYRLSQHWSLILGYTVLWIDGVALAADQLDFTDTPTSSLHVNDGGVLFHGVNTGLRGTW